MATPTSSCAYIPASKQLSTRIRYDRTCIDSPKRKTDGFSGFICTCGMAAVENVAGRMILRTKTKGCKVSTAEEARDYVEAIVANDIREIHINGISLGVEAGKAIASALAQKENIEVVNLSDIFTGRLREEIPPIMIAFSNALLDKTHLREVDFSDNAYGPDGASSFKELVATNRSD